MGFKAFYRGIFPKKHKVSQVRESNGIKMNDYSDFHQYGTIETEYSVIETLTSSTQSSLPSKKLECMVLTYRGDHRIYMNVATKYGTTNKVVNITRQRSVLLHVEVDLLVIQGKMDEALASWIGIAKVIRAIKLQDVKVMCKPSTLAVLLKALCVESLSINRSIFEDAQIISDDLFIKNSQLVSIKLTSPDGEWQSFPLLTDRILSHWAKGKQPTTIQFNHVETSFTIQGIKEMIQMGIHHHRGPLNWMFGRIISSAEVSLSALSDVIQFDLPLQVLPVHKSHIHVINDSSPQLYVFFYTSIRK